MRQMGADLRLPLPPAGLRAPLAPEAPPEAERSRASGRLSSPQAAFASWCFLIWRRTERAALQPSELFCISALLAFSYCIQGRGRSKAPRPHWLCPCAVTSELCGFFYGFWARI